MAAKGNFTVEVLNDETFQKYLAVPKFWICGTHSRWLSESNAEPIESVVTLPPNN